MRDLRRSTLLAELIADANNLAKDAVTARTLAIYAPRHTDEYEERMGMICEAADRIQGALQALGREEGLRRIAIDIPSANDSNGSAA